jgi:predicted GIY-YIG superfamily endonuclease
MRHQNYFVYILTNGDRHTVLYIGVPNGLERQASEHSLGLEWRELFLEMYALRRIRASL